MNDFVIVIDKDQRVRFKSNDNLDKYNRLLYNYQSKIGYDCLIQNVILKDLLNLLSATIMDLDIELKNSK